MLELQNVSKVYQSGEQIVKAIDSVDFQSSLDEFVVIFGRSGSGKTTLLSLIGGLTKPTSGKISINDTDLWTLKDKDLSVFRNKNIGFIFQFASLIPTLGVMENVLLPTIFDGKEEKEKKRDRARELLERVGLAERFNSLPSQLSGGEQRRVVIARALINAPKILLADEPTGDLDEETEEEIIALLRDLNTGEGTGIFMVTHNTELLSVASRAYRMASGSLSKVDRSAVQ